MCVCVLPPATLLTIYFDYTIYRLFWRLFIFSLEKNKFFSFSISPLPFFLFFVTNMPFLLAFTNSRTPSWWKPCLCSRWLCWCWSRPGPKTATARTRLISLASDLCLPDFLDGELGWVRSFVHSLDLTNAQFTPEKQAAGGDRVCRRWGKGRTIPNAAALIIATRMILH